MTLRPYSADLQQTFRSTLLTPGAPEVIDDEAPVVPVAIVAGNLNTTVTVSPTKYTALPANATSTGGVATTTMGTVPAGKVWRVLNASLTVTGAARAQIEFNAVKYLACNSIGALTNNASMSWSYEAAPVLTAGQIARLNVTFAGNDITADITYVEESA